MPWKLLVILCIVGCTESTPSTFVPMQMDQGLMTQSDTPNAMNRTDQNRFNTNIPDAMNHTDQNILDAVIVDMKPMDSHIIDEGIINERLNCDAIDQVSNWEVCETEINRCTAVFEDGAGCHALCSAAGMQCVESFENIDGECAADLTRPALGCVDGHQSDFCVCQRGECVPSCEGRVCGSDGCGDVCGMCNDQFICRDGTCVEPVEILCTTDDCPAFPGAEGEGRNARGGRGGDVCSVTRLDDAGVGSLRHCLDTANGPRTIVFTVAGFIDLQSTLRVRKSNLTIAGQTAPGDGITIRDWGVVIEGDHIIIQHIRFRAGDREKATRNREGFTEDSLSVTGDDIMIDHVSASWGIDENLSCGPGSFRRVTIQYSIISEGLHRTQLFHGEYDEDHPGHSMGGLYKSREGDSSISIHHNLFAHNNNRNPAIGNYESDHRFDADIRNNVIYSCRNMGYVSGTSQRVRVNYIGNYGIFGPASRSEDLFKGNEDSNVQIFQQDNRLDVSRNGRFDGVNNGWRMFGGDYERMNEAIRLQPVTTHTADEALQEVLTQAGARPWSRDEVDIRVLRQVESGSGGLINSQSEVNGWGELDSGAVIVDRDQDGMPDEWERNHGSDPSRPDNNTDSDGDGYTNLENYLHESARISYGK